MIANHNKYISEPDYELVVTKIVKELNALKHGEPNPFLGVKTYFPPKPIITSGTIQTIVLGGTNYDFAVVTIEPGKQPEITFREKGRLHPINTKEDFFMLLNTHLATKVDAIALNVGFPLSYFEGEKGQPDGTFIKATKEHALLGLLGHKVGELVHEKYIPMFHNYALVAVANDIACLTETEAGMIIGTGFNMGIRGEDEQGTYTINLEAGNSKAIEYTQELEAIDQNSLHKGQNLFEKVMSGYYLPLHYNYLAKKYNIDSSLNKSEEMAELAATNAYEAGELARELFARSASYTATQIAALYEFLEKPERLQISVEGSLFKYGYKYRKSVTHRLNALGIPHHVITFHEKDDSSLYGALRLLS